MPAVWEEDVDGHGERLGRQMWETKAGGGAQPTDRMRRKQKQQFYCCTVMIEICSPHSAHFFVKSETMQEILVQVCDISHTIANNTIETKSKE